MSRVANLRRRLARALRFRPPLLKQALGEFFGTFLLVLMGDGVIAQVVLGRSPTGDHGGFTQIALVWGLAVMLGVLCCGRVGKGLINPAVTVGFTVVGLVGPLPALVFILAQVLGGFVGAAGVYSVYREHIALCADAHAEGELTMNTTGLIFVTRPTISNAGAFYDQVVGTALLAGGALAIVDRHNFGVPTWAHPPAIGMLVTAIVGTFCLNAGAALNPARDLGPRLFIAAAGWGADAFTDKSFFFWVPILGPIVGAVLGSLLYELFIGVQVAPDDDEGNQGDGTAMEALVEE